MIMVPLCVAQPPRKLDVARSQQLYHKPIHIISSRAQLGEFAEIR